MATLYQAIDAQVKNMSSTVVYIDPSSEAYYEDKLFDNDNLILNRDDTLAPFIRLRAALEQKHITVHTADHLSDQANREQVFDYYSLGVLKNYEQLIENVVGNLKAFVIFEPPVVDPRLYSALPKLTKMFERVYIHNTIGDGYSLIGVDQSKLRKLYWPQPHKDVLIEFWQKQDRLRRMVIINGNHKPVSYDGELYSKRIEALVALSKFDSIDLYGRGWERWWSRSSMWSPYWKNRKTLMSVYKGACKSKYEILSQYSFALCFENMVMQGYVTEKIFDCFYAGTIPLYLGARDIADLIPDNSYIDCRKFSSWSEIHDYIMEMSDEKIQSMRLEGRTFIKSDQGLKYYNSLLDVFQN